MAPSRSYPWMVVSILLPCSSISLRLTPACPTTSLSSHVLWLLSSLVPFSTFWRESLWARDGIQWVGFFPKSFYIINWWIPISFRLHGKREILHKELCSLQQGIWHALYKNTASRNSSWRSEIRNTVYASAVRRFTPRSSKEICSRRISLALLTVRATLEKHSFVWRPS